MKRTAERYLLCGYLSAYWACLSGHHPSVLVNITEKDVAIAQMELTSEWVVLRVG